MASPREQLQELYMLDRENGDRRLAWYGQERAVEKSHVEAMLSTIEHFHMHIGPSPQLAAWIAEHQPEEMVNGCEGHYDDDATLMSGVGIGEPSYCDGSCQS